MFDSAKATFTQIILRSEKRCEECRATTRKICFYNGKNFFIGGNGRNSLPCEGQLKFLTYLVVGMVGIPLGTKEGGMIRLDIFFKLLLWNRFDCRKHTPSQIKSDS